MRPTKAMTKRVPLRPRHVLILGVAVVPLAIACSQDEDLLEQEIPAQDGGADGIQDERLLQNDGNACRKCSEDALSVLDCEGRTVETCTADDKCVAGVCSSACTLAKTNKSSVGCEFYTFEPPGAPEGCYAVFVANTSDTSVRLTVDYGGVPVKTEDLGEYTFLTSGNGRDIKYTPLPDGRIPAGEVAIAFLAGSHQAFFGCPAVAYPPISPDYESLYTGYRPAFHIESSAPVLMYDMFPYGGGPVATTSASLILPTSTWDTNYVATSDVFKAPGVYASWTAIVATEDGTEVTLNPKIAIVGKIPEVPEADQGVPQTYYLNGGQVLQLVQNGELAGTPIQANKPIGVWGGNLCANVPGDQGGCDSLHQQVSPVRGLGWEYVAVRPRDRWKGVKESPPWRLVGAVNGTKLTYVPSAPPGAPALLDKGDVVEFNASDPFVVTAHDHDHPFYMAGYMEGFTTYIDLVNPDAGGPLGACGDPDFVNTIPPEQFLKSTVFFTDPTYSETHLVVIRKKGENGFADVKLDCAGNLTDWQPVGDFEWTRIDLVRGNFEPQHGCDNGRHVMESDAPFGVTVWGWGSAATGGSFWDPSVPGFYTQAVSYAYPAGQNVKPIQTVVVPAK